MQAVPQDGDEQRVRVISLYATSWRHRAAASGALRLDADLSLESLLPLGKRLEEFHHLFSEQLPRVLHRQRLEPESLHVGDGMTVTSSWLWLFFLPSDQVVAALDFHFDSPSLKADPSTVIDILERMAFADFTIGDASLGEVVALAAEGCRAELVAGPALELAGRAGRVEVPPERHQVLFVPPLQDGPLSDEQAARVLYRVEPPYLPEFVDVAKPQGLNPLGGRKQGLVTAYTSLLVGHDVGIENSVFLTAVQAVGTAARFRQTWHKAHALVRGFRYQLQSEDTGRQRRADMEDLADELGNLELELSFSVETSGDLGLLIPTLRSHSFHHELHKAMELEDRAARVSRMFERLAASIRSELTAIDIREDRERSGRRLRWAIAINVLSVMVVSISFLLGYFGVDADSRIGGAHSMVDGKYLSVYLFAALLAVLPLVVWVVVSLPDWVRRRQAARTRRAARTALPEPV